MTAPRIIMRSIAERAGMTVSTVSRALRNDPQISRETALRIQAFAREMDYRPDPALTALAAYRSSKRPVNLYGKLAVLCHRSEDVGLPGHLAENVKGIRTRAAQLGFEADVFQIKPEEKEQRQLSRILYARGIRGVIVTPLPWKPHAFDWEKFSVVGIGENAVALHLNYVSYDHDAALRETYQQLRACGYKRIGFCNLRESEERNRFLFVSAYLKCLYLDGVPPMKPLLFSGNKEWTPLPWLRRHRFDAVISSYAFIDKLKGSAYGVPEQLGLAGFQRPLFTTGHSDSEDDFATYVVDGTRLGEAAVDFLQTLIQKNQRGVPSLESQHSIMLRGRWKSGHTIRCIK